MRILSARGAACTSVLAMGELASGLRTGARQYRCRRAVLLGLADLGFPIISDGPEQKIRAAFRLLPPLPGDGRTEGLCRLGGLLRELPELRDFEASPDSLTVVETFEMYHQALATHFVTTTGETHRDLRELWDRQPEEWRRRFGHGRRLADYLSAQPMDHNHDLSLASLVEAYAEAWGDPSTAFVRRLAASYDGSLLFFLRAFSLQDTMRAARGEPAARNDMMDLGHFLYVQPGTQLVTDDARMVATARAIACDALSSAEAREALCL